MDNLKRSLCALVALLLIAPALLAQEIRLEERLPSKTLFYMLWRGSANHDAVRATNPLLRMADDPQLLDFQKKMMTEIMRAVLPGGETTSAWQEMLTKPTGAMAFGFLEGDAKAASVLEGASKFAARMFVVYHNVSKFDYDLYWKQIESAAGTAKASVETVEIAGRKVKKLTIEKSEFYQVGVGEYYFQAGTPEILNDLIARMEGNTAPADSIVQNAFWQSSRSQLPGATSVEFFFRFPKVEDFGTLLPIPPGSQSAQFDLPAFLKALHLDRFHGIVGSVNFEAAATRTRISLLGDTSPGSLFDVFQSGAANFRSVAAAPSDAQYCAAYQLDLRKTYEFVRAVAEAAAPGGQGAAMVEMAETGISAQLGMSIGDALKMFTGEFGIYPVKSSPESDDFVVVAGVENPEGVLKLLRLVLASDLSSEDVQGTTTYLTYATDYTDPKTQARRKQFRTIGVAPSAVVVAPRKTMVREALARMTAPSPAASLVTQPSFVSARGRLPQQLSAISFFDFSKMEWEKLAAEGSAAMQEAEKKAVEQQQKNPSGPKPPDIKISALIKDFPLALLKQYLHTTFGGWWKDARGMHNEVILD